MLRVLLITDSLALPRNKPEPITFFSTYPGQLKSEYGSRVDFFQLSLGGGTLPMLASYSKYYNSINPHLVIVQSGIVDCAPRALKDWEKSVLNRLPIIGNGVLKFSKKNAVVLRRIRNISRTSPKHFQDGVVRIKKQFNKSRLIWINIMDAPSSYQLKMPRISDRIIEYNTIIQNKTEILLEKTDVDWISEDGHHMNIKGHNAIFKKIKEVLDMELKKG